jgi:hypothetical protein
MSMDPNKWINTLPPTNNLNTEEKYKLDGARWVKTLPRKTIISTNKKYSIIISVFIFSLIIVSSIKNETRNLQKEINNLKKSVNLLKNNIHLANLENEVITSPENISLLAKLYLESDYQTYTNSQISALNKKNENKVELEKVKKSQKLKNMNNLKKKLNLETSKVIKKKKKELAKLKEIYSQPEELPKEVRVMVAEKIQKTQQDIKKIYLNPKESIDLKKIQRWASIQVVKAFLGLPIIPGK